MHGTVHLFDRLPEVGRPVARPSLAPSPRRSVPLIGVIRNLRSHRAGAFPEWSGQATLIVESPARREELQEVLERFADRGVDYIAIAGGDGTVRDVLTCGAGIFGEIWPPLILLPNGKTNALALDLGLSQQWSLPEAIEAARAGRTEQRRPLVVAQRDNADARVQGFVFGGGAYTAAIQLGQHTHSKGAFNNLGVAITAVWSVGQAILGRAGNMWRRGTPMRVVDEEKGELPHSGIGRRDERYLVFVSTLGLFPAGLRPFRDIKSGLRVALLDSSHRGLMLRLPLIFRGKVSEGMRRLGYHVFGAEALQIDIGDSFILDGEAFPPGRYRLSLGPKLRFVVP